MTLAFTPVSFFNGALTTSIVTFYTVGGAITASITKEIILCNSDAVSRLVTFYAVPSGGSPGQANKILAQQKVDAGSTLVIALSTVLSAGDSLQGFADRNSVVSARISGVEGA